MDHFLRNEAGQPSNPPVTIQRVQVFIKLGISCKVIHGCKEWTEIWSRIRWCNDDNVICCRLSYPLATCKVFVCGWQAVITCFPSGNMSVSLFGGGVLGFCQGWKSRRDQTISWLAFIIFSKHRLIFPKSRNKWLRANSVMRPVVFPDDCQVPKPTAFVALI